MNQTVKILLMVFMVLYVISPVDVLPGPVDDLIVILFSIAAQRRPGIINS